MALAEDVTESLVPVSIFSSTVRRDGEENSLPIARTLLSDDGGSLRKL